jgi:hypothetical protein
VRSCQSSSYKRLSPSSSVYSFYQDFPPSFTDGTPIPEINRVGWVVHWSFSVPQFWRKQSIVYSHQERSSNMKDPTIQFERAGDAKRRDHSRLSEALGGKSCTKWSTASCFVADHFVRFLNSQLVSCTWSWRSMYGSRANPYLICCSAGFLSWGKWRLPTVSSPPC